MRSLPFALSALSVAAAVFAPARPDLSAWEQVTRQLRPRLPAYTNAGGDVMPGLIKVKLRTAQADALFPSADAPLAPTRTRAVAIEALEGATPVSRTPGSNWTIWSVPAKTDVRAYAAYLRRTGQVVYAEPVFRIRPLLPTPNDGDWSYVEHGMPMVPLGDNVEFRRLWYLDDIAAESAWGIWPNRWYTAATKPKTAPLVAIIDTGIDVGHPLSTVPGHDGGHPDFINAGGTGTDVNEGGQFETALGTYFTFGAPVRGGETLDIMGHGTHVAGLALAAGNNGAFEGKGIVGTGYACRGLSLRVFDDSGNGSDADAAAAILYAADNGADVINLSLGTKEFSQMFQDAVTYAHQRGSLVVCAGNESGSGGGALGPIYPAACSGTLAVTANGPNGVVASDNYAGTGNYLDLGAPGGNAIIDIYDPEDPKAYLQYIYSTTMREDNPILASGQAVGYELNYGYLIGTSMATPLVAGAAGNYYGYKRLRQGDGWANVRTFRAIQRSAIAVYGAPKGSWENNQGYGAFNFPGLMLDMNFRNATAGGIEGIVYLEGTAQINASITAQRIGSSTKIKTTSRPDGCYRFDQLQSGQYVVTALAGGKVKSKRAVVVTGTDAPATDFWLGTYTGDDTPPTIRRFRFSSVTSANRVRLIQWGYDTETGIDRFTARVGTTPGGSDVLAEQEYTLQNNTVDLPIPNYSPNNLYYVTGTYTNGAGLTSSSLLQLGTNNATTGLNAVLSSPILSPTSPLRGRQSRVQVTVRNTGSVAWTNATGVTFALTAANPTRSAIWQMVETRLPAGVTVAPGASYTFPFNVRAPMGLGTVDMQWQMTRNGVPFGNPTPFLGVVVK